MSGSSVSGPKVATIECSGRTQVSAPGSFDRTPQRMDFGHGKVLITSARISPITSMRGAARLLDHRDIEVALLVGLHLGFADRFQARGFEEAGDGVLRRADARALLLLAHVRLARRHAVHRERQPPRRHECLGAFVDEPGIDQAVGDRLAQILRRPRLHARGNFFGEKLEQKIGHGSRALSPPGEGHYSLLWLPSHIGFFAERLQAQNQTFSEVVGLNSIGVKDVTLCEPSQNGCFFDIRTHTTNSSCRPRHRL